MPNNFPKAIPDFKQSMKTISMFKDEYLLDFINTENLGLEIEDIDERVVEQEIVRNMRDFILQFGKDLSLWVTSIVSYLKEKKCS